VRGVTTVLKLGGSVVTVKDEPETVDAEALAAVATAIDEAAVDDLVLVHGGGSFGHVHAAEWGVTRSAGTHDPDAVRAIHGAMRRLNDAVCDALCERGVPAVPHHPYSAGYRESDATLVLPVEAVRAKRDEGFCPVLHGDLVSHVGKGATVVSGDELVVSLARDLGAERVGVCSTVPGVLDDDGGVVEEIHAYDDVETFLGASESTDVTGGMAAKVRALLDLEAPVSVFGPGDLGTFLAGGEPGTRVG